MMRRAQPWLGTLVDITINDIAENATDEARLESSMSDAFVAVATVHRLMSFHDFQSDVAGINRANVGAIIEVAADTMAVLTLACELNAASDGVFNINCAARLIEWGLLPDPPELSDLSSLEKVRPTATTNSCGLIIENVHCVRKTHPVLIDLGGIAKGYAVDCAITSLRRAKITSACVNAGGDLRVLGSTPFTVSIRDPVTITGIAQQVVIVNSALATSAPYFSRREFGGRLVSALVDGRDGIAITHAVSVSVIAPSCMLADALTKIVMATANPQHFLLDHFGAQALMLGEKSC